MSDMEASIKLTADMTAVEKQLADIIARFESLSGQSLPGAKAGLTEVEAATNKVAVASGAAKTELTGMAASMEAAARASSGLGTAMEFVGAESAGGAQKIRLMNEAVKELAAASGPLLLLVGAFEALSKVFEFVHEGVEGAANLEKSMSQLRGVVQGSGQDWETAKVKIEEFINTETMASGFTKEQLTPVLQDLAARFGDVNDAMAVTAVAEEVARGTGQDLMATEQQMTGLLGGRLGMLAKLDPALKQMIANHASERDIIIELHKHYQNALKDQDDYATAQERAKVAGQEVAEQIGGSLLPMLTNLEISIVGLWKNMEKMGQGFGQIWQGIGMVVGGVIDTIKDNLGSLAKAMADVLTGNWNNVGNDLSSMKGGGMQKMSAGLQKIGSGGMEVGSGLNSDSYATGEAIIKKATDAHERDLEERLKHLSTNPTGKQKSGSKGSGAANSTITETMDGQLTIQTDALADAQKKLDAALKSNDNSLAQYQNAVNSATTEDQKRRAEQALLDAQTKVLTENHKLLNDSVYSLTEQGKKLTEQRDKDMQKANQLAAAHDALANTILKQGSATQDQQVKLKSLQADYDAAKKAVEDDNNVVNENTTHLDKNTAALAANNKKREEQKNLLAGVQESFDAFNQKMAHDDAEKMATLGMNTQQLYQYYGQQYEQDYALWKHYVDTKQTYLAQQILPQMEADERNANNERLKIYQEDVNNKKKAFDTMSKDLSTFLNDFIVQHKSLKDSLKGIYDQILKAFEEMIAQMVIKALFFKSVAGSSLGMGGGGFLSFLGLGGGGNGGGNSSMSNFQSAASALPAYFGQNGTIELGTNSVKALTGSTTGVSPFSATANAMVTPFTVLAASAGIGGLIGSMEGAGTGAQSTHAMNGAIGGVVGAAAGGIGALALGLGGGAFGGLGAGLSMFGPAGWAMLAGGALLGGVLGGAMGPHWGPASNYPDRSDTQHYGQFVADWHGAGGNFNGQNIGPESQYSGANSMSAQMIAWANQNPNDPLAKQILGLGTSAQQLGIANEHNGTFTLADGKQISVSALESLGSQWQQTMAKNPQSASPIFSVDRMAPDFNQARVSAWTANTRTPGTPGGSIGDAIGDIIGGLFGTRKLPLPQPPIHIHIENPQIYGGQGLDDFANAIQERIQRNITHNYRNQTTDF